MPAAELLRHARNDPQSGAQDLYCRRRAGSRQRSAGHCRDELDALCLEFRLTVENCLEPVGMVAHFTFGSSADADSDTPELFSLRGNDAPENVGLEIGDSRRNTIKPGEEVRFNAVGTGEDFVFNVRLRESKPTVRGGRFRRPVTVLVDFM